MPESLPNLEGTRDPLVGRIMECIQELLPLENLDDLLRAGVELARTKLGVERCALWLVDFDKATLRGTYGTDLHGNTTDEHANRCPLVDLEKSLPCPFMELRTWTLSSDPNRYTWTENGPEKHEMGWNTIIPITGPEGNVGCFFQDAVISNQPLDPHHQDLMGLYGSLLGQLAGRRLAESRESLLSSGLEAVLAAADELLAYDDLDTLHRRIVELARERLGVARAGLFLATEESTSRFTGTWGTDWDGRTSDEHRGILQLEEQAVSFAKHGTVLVRGHRWSAFQPFPMSWFEPDGTKAEFAEGWNATHFLCVGDRVLGLLCVDPGKTCEPMDPRKMDLLATYCALVARILDRRLAQHALRQADTERIESLGALAGGLAHDFNNLLAAILGSVELLMDHPRTSPERARRRLTDARDACLRGKALAGQLLTFSRGGAPSCHPLQTIPFLDETIRSAVGSQRLDWTLESPEAPWNLLADEAQMGQVFLNLTVNACHWQPQGGSLRIELHNRILNEGEWASLSSGMYLQVDVHDGGPGIPDSVRTRVFDPYFSTRPGGSGLGLATCQSIVLRHGGHIECLASSSGAHFRLLLPATDDCPQPSSGIVDYPSDLSDRKILVMDDEPVLRGLLRDLLESHGAEVVTAEEGEQAAKAWSQALAQDLPFDLGIFDITITSGMGGIEAAKRIHDADPPARLLVCSGYSNEPFLSNPDKFGFCGVIPKPFRMAELLEVVTKTMARPES